MQGSKLVTICRIAARLDSEAVGKHALAAQIYDVLATQVDLSPEGKKLLQDFFGFGVNGEKDFRVGDFGEDVPGADYQTRRDPFLDPSVERAPEPKSDMLAKVSEAAVALENLGEYVLAHTLRSEYGA
jgi:hypothetical protein